MSRFAMFYRKISYQDPVEPCPPHEWADIEALAEESHVAAYLRGTALYICRKCQDYWPDARQLHPTQKVRAR
jgi:hypothetical protein